MSNYTKSTNFTAKDSLPTGDANKVIRGSEFDTEFDAIQTAVGTKADLAGPTFTGTITLPTVDINAGAIDGTTIGGSSAGAGTFTNLTASGTVNFNGATVSNLGTITTANLDGGTADNIVIGGATPAAGTFTALAATSATVGGAAVLTSVSFSNLDAGAVTLSSETFSDVDNQIPTNAAVIDYVAATIPLISEVNDLSANVTWANVPDANITQSSVTQHQAALAIAASQLSDVTATATELNYTDGVTSNIQTQLNAKVGATYTGDVDITGELIVDSYNESYVAPTSSSNATTVDCEAGNVFSHTLTENTTFTFSNPPASGTAYGFSLKIVQDASASGYTVTWPAAIDWPAATAPTLTATASAVDQFVFYTHDGGTTWYGFTAGQDLG